jgi:hypothetical protein
MRPPASKIKRKPNDGYEPLAFRQDDIKKMTPKQQGEDLLRILIAGLQRKLNLPQTTTNPQAASLTVSLKTMYCGHFFDRFRRSDECESAI